LHCRINEKPKKDKFCLEALEILTEYTKFVLENPLNKLGQLFKQMQNENMKLMCPDDDL
jgi:hypothetical protein